MARRQVLEVQCDRCGKTETQDVPPNTEQDDELIISFRGEEARYSDLCVRCRSACENYFKSITKQSDDKADEAPPLEEKKGLLSLGGKR